MIDNNLLEVISSPADGLSNIVVELSPGVFELSQQVIDLLVKLTGPVGLWRLLTGIEQVPEVFICSSEFFTESQSQGIIRIQLGEQFVGIIIEGTHDGIAHFRVCGIEGVQVPASGRKVIIFGLFVV